MSLMHTQRDYVYDRDYDEEEDDEEEDVEDGYEDGDTCTQAAYLGRGLGGGGGGVDVYNNSESTLQVNPPSTHHISHHQQRSGSSSSGGMITNDLNGSSSMSGRTTDTPTDRRVPRLDCPPLASPFSAPSLDPMTLASPSPSSLSFRSQSKAGAPSPSSSSSSAAAWGGMPAAPPYTVTSAAYVDPKSPRCRLSRPVAITIYTRTTNLI